MEIGFFEGKRLFPFTTCMITLSKSTVMLFANLRGWSTAFANLTALKSTTTLSEIAAARFLGSV